MALLRIVISVFKTGSACFKRNDPILRNSNPQVSAFIILMLCLLSGFSSGILHAAEPPKPELAMSFRPAQKGIDYEIPKKEEISKCVVKVEKTKSTSGWIVYGPSGQILRRFIDTDGDNVVDQWRYFQMGIEVYRDIDSNNNNNVDQSRWLNTGGSRWGVDTNEDGKIDYWKIISAEEVSKEVVSAMANKDEWKLKALLITKEDLNTLGVKPKLASQILNMISSPKEKMLKNLEGSKIMNAKTKWMRFDSSTPGCIPADQGKATKDIMVHENAMAIVESGGKTGLLQIGEILQVGKVWKLTQIPISLEGNSVQVVSGGILIQPADPEETASMQANSEVSPEVQKLLDELSKLDSSSPLPTVGLKVLSKYNSQRADILEKLVASAKTDEERKQWTQQLVDGVTASVQTGANPEGIKRLEKIEANIIKADSKSPLIAYIRYRILLGKFSLEFQKARNEDRQKIQIQWIKSLENYAESFPSAPDTPDALLQIAMTAEFNRKPKEARKWYEKLNKNFASSIPGQKATGALRRLDLTGKTFQFSGQSLTGQPINAKAFQGKVLLVLFWSTWCKPCSEDLPQIKALYQKYRGQGFEILGVNLDSTKELIEPYMKKNQMIWPQIHEGGMDSPPAVAFGIMSLPTMILVDSKGKVISRNTNVADLKSLVPGLLKKR